MVLGRVCIDRGVNVVVRGGKGQGGVGSIRLSPQLFYIII